MAQKTQLTVQGVPGQIQVFIAKTAASTKGSGLFTVLTCQGIPGQRYSFTAKTAAGVTAQGIYRPVYRPRRRFCR